MPIAITNARAQGLEGFIKRERGVLLSVVFLASTLHLAAQAIYVAPKRQLTDGLARASALLEHENKTIKRARLVASDATPAPVSAQAPAAALTRLVSAAAAHEVEIGGLAPEGSSKDAFRAQIMGDFRSTVRAIARLEKMDVVVRGFEIAPAAPGDASRLLSTLEIVPGDDTLVGLHPRGVEVPELSALVNPFAQRTCVAPAAGGKSAKDAAPKGMKLSAVTQLGKQTLATINGLDYAIGDLVGAYRVVDIGPDSARLVGARGGDSCLVLSLPVILSGAAPDSPSAP